MIHLSLVPMLPISTATMTPQLGVQGHQSGCTTADALITHQNSDLLLGHYSGYGREDHANTKKKL